MMNGSQGYYAIIKKGGHGANPKLPILRLRSREMKRTIPLDYGDYKFETAHFHTVVT